MEVPFSAAEKKCVHSFTHVPPPRAFRRGGIAGVAHQNLKVHRIALLVCTTFIPMLQMSPASAGADLFSTLPPGCPELLKSSPEVRVMEFYARLVAEYRNAIDAKAYEAALRRMVSRGDPFDFEVVRAEQGASASLLRKIGQIRDQGVLASGEKISAARIEREARVHLNAELRALEELNSTAESVRRETRKPRPFTRTLEWHDDREFDLLLANPDLTRALSVGRFEKASIFWDVQAGVKISEFLPSYDDRVSYILADVALTKMLVRDQLGTSIRDLKTGGKLREIGSDLGDSPQVDAELKFALRNSGRELKIFDLDADKMISEFSAAPRTRSAWITDPSDIKHAFNVSSDAISESQKTEWRVEVWALDRNEKIGVLEGHLGKVVNAVLSHDEKKCITVAWDKTLIVWDLETGRVLMKIDTESMSMDHLQVSPDFSRAVGVSASKDVFVWNLVTGARTFDFQTHQTLLGFSINADITRALFSFRTGSAPDVNGNAIWVVDLDSGLVIKELFGHSLSVKELRVTPDFKSAISAGEDKTVRWWDLDRLLGDQYRH